MRFGRFSGNHRGFHQPVRLRGTLGCVLMSWCKVGVELPVLVLVLEFGLAMTVECCVMLTEINLKRWRLLNQTVTVKEIAVEKVLWLLYGAGIGLIYHDAVMKPDNRLLIAAGLTAARGPPRRVGFV